MFPRKAREETDRVRGRDVNIHFLRNYYRTCCITTMGRCDQVLFRDMSWLYVLTLWALLPKRYRLRRIKIISSSPFMYFYSTYALAWLIALSILKRKNVKKKQQTSIALVGTKGTCIAFDMPRIYVLAEMGIKKKHVKYQKKLLNNVTSQQIPFRDELWRL
jgi:hypothetical protein